jgi:hypothetical protein
MSEKAKNPEYFGVDTEVFQFLLERDVTHAGLWTTIAEIQERAKFRMNREVSAEEVRDAVAKTHYTQRRADGAATNISPYNQEFTDNVLSRVKLLDGVSKKSWEWGY